MKQVKYGDRVHWTEGSQYDRMTHKGLVVKVTTKVQVVDENGVMHEIDIDDLYKGWKK